MNDRIILEKISRLQSGAAPRVLDLFSGCGGLSLGFQSAGFLLTAAIESDACPAASYGANFHAGDPQHAASRDITKTSPGQLARHLKLGKVANAFDVIVGGPPCQAFARVGRSKLREIEAHPEAFRHDPRAKLYTPYLAYVKACRPLALLMENVPDAINFGGHNVPEEVCEVLEDLGYVCAYTLLNAAYYGVPQTRERMFLIAYHHRVTETVTFPEPTHWIQLPSGYEGSRKFALKTLSKSGSFSDAHHYVNPPTATSALPPAVTAHAAIGDLPKLRAPEMARKGKLRRGARKFDELIKYDGRRSVSPYAHQLKNWPGFEAGDGVWDHVIRYLPRDYPIFARMSEGDQYPEAHALALKMFESAVARKRYPAGSTEYELLRKQMVPPYDVGKFPNKWRKIARDQPVRTVLAHLSKDSYTHIHYDDAQARTISVREAARLQSFPDGFIFKGSMNDAFRQIGNAVPPLLAKALAVEMMDAIRGCVNRRSATSQRQVAHYPTIPNIETVLLPQALTATESDW